MEQLVTLPETDIGVPVNRFSQSRKWRECLPKDLRVQMVQLGSSHFYIYEPVQLDSKKVVVPIFFYLDKGIVMSKCLKLQMKTTGNPVPFQMLIAEEEEFSSNIYITVEVSKFMNTFSQIRLSDGKMLADVVDHKVWRKCLFLCNISEVCCHLLTTKKLESRA